MKDDPAIESDDLEVTIPKAVKGDRQALEALMIHPWMMWLLYRLAEWARRRKNIETDVTGRDILELIADRIRAQIHTLKNPRKRSWRACLQSWGYPVTRTCCTLARRSKRAEQLYKTEVEHAHTIRTQHKMKIIAPPAAMSPQEELEEREEAPLRRRMEQKRKRQKSQVPDIVRKMCATLKADEARIFYLWAKGNNYREISEQTGIPLATVAKKQQRLLRVLFDKISEMVDDERGEGRSRKAKVVTLPQDKKNWDGIRQLIMNSLRDYEPPEEGPRAGL